MAGERFDAVVVGAGSFGLAAAAELQRRRLTVAVLERADGVGASWRRRYDGLRLNSIRSMSGLPRGRLPRSAGRWPLKEELIAHLERYVERHGLEVRLGVEVRRVEREGEDYVVETASGPFRAGAVVVATGYDRVPKMPDWPGRESFEVELIHSSEYRNPVPYSDRKVMVVGAGNTGTELAVQLADGGAAKVWMAVRTPPNLIAAETFGLPATPFGALADRLPPALVDRLTPLMTVDLSEHGLGRSPYGMATEIRVKGLGAVVERGIAAAVRQGRVEVVAAVEGFDGRRVLLADGGELRPDAVIAATGYRMGLEPLVGHLGVLGPDGPSDGAGRRDASEGAAALLQRVLPANRGPAARAGALIEGDRPRRGGGSPQGEENQAWASTTASDTGRPSPLPSSRPRVASTTSRDATTASL